MKFEGKWAKGRREKEEDEWENATRGPLRKRLFGCRILESGSREKSRDVGKYLGGKVYKGRSWNAYTHISDTPRLIHHLTVSATFKSISASASCPVSLLAIDSVSPAEQIYWPNADLSRSLHPVPMGVKTRRQTSVSNDSFSKPLPFSTVMTFGRVIISIWTSLVPRLRIHLSTTEKPSRLYSGTFRGLLLSRYV